MPLHSNLYAQIKLNTSEIEQSLLNIENKVRSNPLKWNGQFSPQLLSVLIKKYAKPGDILFDPFLGSGTLLFEAGSSCLVAYGTEVNPAAVILSQLYKLINIPKNARQQALIALSALLENYFPLPLMVSTSMDHEPQSVLAALRSNILSEKDEPRLLIVDALIILLNSNWASLTADQVFREFRNLSRLILNFPYSDRELTVLHADARKTPLSNRLVNIVITSPPYINVFNYHQQYRDTAEFLGWNLLEVAKSEMGSNRKHRGNRFLTVIQYCLDMAMVLMELKRVCHPDARVIFVVGKQSAILGTPFYNGEIVAEIAHRVCGFDMLIRQERMFRNRFGENIYEDILHFVPITSHTENILEAARQISKDILKAAYDTAPTNAQKYLAQALEKADLVQPSPIFDGDTTFSWKNHKHD